MQNITVVGSVPFEATDPHFCDGKLLYASSHNIYHPKHIIALDSPIKSLCSNKLFKIALTDDFLYQISRRNIIMAKMRISKKCYKIWVKDTYLVLGYHSSLDIFRIPKKYARTPFKLQKRIVTGEIPVCANFHENMLAVGFANNTVKIISLDSGHVFEVGSFLECIINVFIVDSLLTVVAQNGIFSYTLTLNDKLESPEKTQYQSKSIGISYCWMCDLPKTQLSGNGAEGSSLCTCKSDVCVSEINLKTKIVLENVIAAAHYKYKQFIVNKDSKDVCQLSIYSDEALSQIINLTHQDITHLIADKDRLILKKLNDLIVCDLYGTCILQHVIYSKFSAINHFNQYVALASENYVAIYKSEGEPVKHHSFDVSTQIKHVFLARSLLLTISHLGTARMFDSNNMFCFKMFDIGLQIFSCACNEDLSMLFVASAAIYVYDTKRGKVIDEIKVHTGPVSKIIYANSYVYSLGFDNTIQRTDVYSQSGNLNIVPETTIIDFFVDSDVYLLFENDISIYNSRLGFIKGIVIDKNLRMQPKKIVTSENLIFIHGKTREGYFLYVFSIEHGFMIQRIKIKDDARLSCAKKFLLVLSENNLSIFGPKKIGFNPVDLEQDLDEDGIETALGNQEIFIALLGACKLNHCGLINEVLENINHDDIPNYVKSLPEKYCEILRGHLKNNDQHGLWLKEIMFYHTKHDSSPNEIRKFSKNDALAQENRNLVNALFKKLTL